MRINLKVTTDIETGEVLERISFEYQGPLELCGGGPSKEQKQAAADESALAHVMQSLGNKQDARADQAFQTVFPFAQDRLKNGLPFFNALTDYTGGTTARAFAPARANLLRRLSNMGDLPSGSREQSLTDLDSAQAQAFDQGLQSNLFANEQAKQNAASMLFGQQQANNPLGAYGGAESGYGNIATNNGLKKPGYAGLIGGAASGALSSLPF